MLRRPTALFILAALALAACASDDDTAPRAGVTEDSAASDTSIEEAGSGGGLARQYLQRYCEVLAVTVAEAGSSAEVWGTQGLNDCPEAAFDSIDAPALAEDLGVTAAVPNGPRYWVLDDIVANELAGSGETRTLGGIDMRSIALVDLGAGPPDRTPLTETSVERDTEFVFAAGREVYELTGPDGSVYVMQSFSVEVDPTLTVDGLADLGATLQLPEGWEFTSRVVDEPLVVEDIDGVATVIQDELRNTYQLHTRG